MNKKTKQDENHNNTIADDCKDESRSMIFTIP